MAGFGVYTLSIANAVGATGGMWAFEPSLERNVGFCAD
jgi:hypothetical protein